MQQPTIVNVVKVDIHVEEKPASVFSFGNLSNILKISAAIALLIGVVYPLYNLFSTLLNTITGSPYAVGRWISAQGISLLSRSNLTHLLGVGLVTNLWDRFNASRLDVLNKTSVMESLAGAKTTLSVQVDELSTRAATLKDSVKESTTQGVHQLVNGINEKVGIFMNWKSRVYGAPQSSEDSCSATDEPVPPTIDATPSKNKL